MPDTAVSLFLPKGSPRICARCYGGLVRQDTSWCCDEQAEVKTGKSQEQMEPESLWTTGKEYVSKLPGSRHVCINEQVLSEQLWSFSLELCWVEKEFTFSSLFCWPALQLPNYSKKEMLFKIRNPKNNVNCPQLSVDFFVLIDESNS